MHICRPSDFFSREQASFMLEAIEEALQQAHEVLSAHQSEDPPLVDIQTIGEAAQSYIDLIATQEARIVALQDAKAFFEEVK